LKKLLVLSACLLLLPIALIGQIHPLADQYMMNFFQVNPAVAGVIRYDPLVINARQQGLQWEHAPSSQSVTYQGKLFKEKDYFNNKGFLNRGENAFGKLGFGIGLFNYSYGSVHQTGFHLDYSYHIFIGGGRLCFGLSPVFLQFRANLSDDSFTFDENPDDLWLPQGNDPIKVSFLDFNAGVHYYSETVTLGFSCIQMFNSSIHLKGQYGFPTLGKPMLNPDLSRSFYGYGAYLININRSFQVEPMLMLKYNANTINKIRFDLTATAYILNHFESGVTFKWSDGVAAFMGVRLNKVQVRYLFEYPLSGRTPRSFTSHMIQVGFNFGQRIK
jgi:type IX secretion system PorP/SprF family membrane protein